MKQFKKIPKKDRSFYFFSTIFQLGIAIMLFIFSNPASEINLGGEYSKYVFSIIVLFSSLLTLGLYLKFLKYDSFLYFIPFLPYVLFIILFVLLSKSSFFLFYDIKVFYLIHFIHLFSFLLSLYWIEKYLEKVYWIREMILETKDGSLK